MQVTEVRINPAKGGRVRAFASIVIDDCFIVNDLRVLEGREGQLFVTMPARKSRNGQMRDVAHPLNSDVRQEIETRVLEEYERAVRDLAVPDSSSGARQKGPQGVMDRIASRLFVEEFWLVEPPSSDGASD